MAAHLIRTGCIGCRHPHESPVKRPATSAVCCSRTRATIASSRSSSNFQNTVVASGPCRCCPLCLESISSSLCFTADRTCCSLLWSCFWLSLNVTRGLEPAPADLGSPGNARVILSLPSSSRASASRPLVAFLLSRAARPETLAAAFSPAAPTPSSVEGDVSMSA